MRKWLDILNAPKDGTLIIGRDYAGNTSHIAWSAGAASWVQKAPFGLGGLMDGMGFNAREWRPSVVQPASRSRPVAT